MAQVKTCENPPWVQEMTPTENCEELLKKKKDLKDESELEKEKPKR